MLQVFREGFHPPAFGPRKTPEPSTPKGRLVNGHSAVTLRNSIQLL